MALEFSDRFALLFNHSRMSTPQTSLKVGGLIVDQSHTETRTPTWCQNRKNSILHHMRLLWMPCGEKMSNNSNLMSPSFILGTNGIKANLIIVQRVAYSSLYFNLSPEHVASVFGKIRLSTTSNFLDRDRKSLSWEPSELIFSKANVDDAYGWKLLNKRDAQVSYSYSTYSFRAEIEVIILENAPGDSTVSKHSNDFRDLRMEQNPAGLGTDTILQIGTTQLGAHKFVLSARSPVLKTMLNADMAEARSGIIELKHMSIEAAQDFIGFIYSGQIDRERLVGTAAELLEVAAMYDMPDLLAVCESTLRGIITTNSTAQLLTIAALHDAKLLKADTLDFLARNKNAVTATEGWAEAMATNSKMLLEAILEIV